MRLVALTLALVLFPTLAHAAGFIISWQSPGCPSACVYQPGYQVRAASRDFELVYEAISGGVSATFTEQFTLPHTPTFDVDFYVRSVNDQGVASDWAGPASLPAAAWASPANPHNPTINSVTAVP